MNLSQPVNRLYKVTEYKPTTHTHKHTMEKIVSEVERKTSTHVFTGVTCTFIAGLWPE